LTKDSGPTILIAVRPWEGKMEKVQKRESLVCICAECHKIIRTVGVVEPEERPLISHGICPECADRLYGDLFRRKHTGDSPGA
jgi:hypothetical protein